MATKDYLLADILSLASEEDEEGTLKDLLDQRSENHRHCVFLSKLYAVQDLAVHLNTPGNEIINEVVEALVELGYAFEDTFKEEIESDVDFINMSMQSTLDAVNNCKNPIEALNEKVEDLVEAAKVPSNPSPEEFLAEALDITLEIQRKKEESETLIAEAKELEQKLTAFSSKYSCDGGYEKGFELMDTIYHDKQSNKLFLVQRCCETDTILFFSVEPMNFAASHIVDSID